MILDEAQDHAAEEENYFVSMSDMMVGLVFIFIIMLMYFALQFRNVTDQLAGANQTRAQILQELKQSLKNKGVDVTIDTQNGVLHLPDSILFEKGAPELGDKGVDAAGKLAQALAEVLPCYTSDGGVRTGCKGTAKHLIESAYVEGHTDVDTSRGVGCLRDNLALSACRAVATFRALMQSRRALRDLCSRREDGRCEKILSVSGYGPERPLDDATDEVAKGHNRRIDLRLIMVTPDAGAAVRAVSDRLAAK
jgi:flagellar motor protein MotB